MAQKNYFKKIFIATAALFILFAPIGITAGTARQGVATASPLTTQQVHASPYSGLTLAFSVNLAEASTTTAGTSAGATTVQNPNFLACAQNIATCGVYYATLVANGIGGLLLTLGAWLVKLGLQFNANVYNSPAVQTGFSVSLAIANLGFVLGIIIIAIATIIRNQTYGIKQLLWKLVFMAVLVNFGLVITAPIVGFANGLSTYFINATSPSAATGGYEAYVATLTTAFQPQQSALTGSSGITMTSLCGSLIAQAIGGPAFGAICAITGNNPATSSASDTIWQNTMALIFDVVFSFVAAFTFLSLAVLLIVRYLMLGGLLIVLPLAWLTFVFPKFDNSYSKWWNEFIKWTFFPPLALFFIYLAFITAVNSTATTPAGTATNTYMAAALGGTSTNNQLEQGITTETGVPGTLVAQAADEVLLVGLMIMGLLFASSLAGKAGSTAVNAGTAVSNAAIGYVGKKTKAGATRVASRAIPNNVKENLQAGRYGWLPKRVQVATGVGLGNIQSAGTAGTVAAEAHNADEYAKDPKAFARILAGDAGSFGRGGMSKERRMAMLAKLAKDEDLQKEVSKEGGGHVLVGGKTMQEFLKDNEAEFKGLQQERLYESLKDKSGLTPLEIEQENAGQAKIVQELGRKKDLDEIHGLLQSEKDPETVGEMTKDQKEKLDAYKKRKQDLEYAANTGEITQPEKDELEEMRKMESVKGNYMSEAEKASYQNAQDKFTENNNKLKAWATKNPEGAADFFQDHSRAVAKLTAQGKPVPLTFQPQAVKALQAAMLTAMAEGFSPQNAKGLIEAIGKKNNLKYLENSMDNMDKNTVEQIRKLAKENKQFATWVSKNPGRNMVDLNKMFDIKPEKQPKGGNDTEES